MWLAAWKLVSNDAKRTVAPPNAKHSTLPQGCFFMFLFLSPVFFPGTALTFVCKWGGIGRFWVEFWVGGGEWGRVLLDFWLKGAY